MKRVGIITATAVGLMFLAPAGADLASASGTHQITLMPNGSTSSTKVIKTSAHSYKLPKVSFSRPGYSFVGWAKTLRGPKVYSDRATVRFTSSIKLYAIWKEVLPTAPNVVGHTVGSLLWHEEFRGASGSAIDSNSWTARYCGLEASNGGGTCHNNEPQWYLPSAVALDGTSAGNAVITTKRVYSAPVGGICKAWSGCQFTSARFDTQGKVAFKYGYIEARIKMPAGGRNWPAFWALGDSMNDVGWPRAGEIDIAEQGGNLPMRNSAAVHFSVTEFGGGHRYIWGEELNQANYQTGFHTYGLAWLPGRLEFYVDRELFWTATPTNVQGYWPFDKPFFLIFNNAVQGSAGFGGNYSGWAESQTVIDYVHAWQLNGQGSVVKK